MKFGSLFAGIGGIDLGLERAGMECKWQVEIDDFCLGRLDKHWPSVPKYKDVRDVGKHNLETVDLIVGGFPCQPHSVAGKRKGAEDDRNLWPEFSRIIAELRPRYVLAENVLGIVSTYLDAVLSDLESQAYTTATFNLPACAFDAPHRRERIFIVAFSLSGRNRSDRQRTSSRTENQKRGNAEERREIIRGRKETSFTSDIEKSGETLADTSPMFRPSIKRDEQNGILSEDMADSAGERLERRIRRPSKGTRFTSKGWWEFEPDVGRVAHGVPSRVDRLRGLGNAVVPQVAEWIGRRIIEFEEQRSTK